MRTPRLLVPTLVALALAFPAGSAAGCTTNLGEAVPYTVIETPATRASLTGEGSSGTYYLYWDGGCDPECHFWDPGLFEETNGVPGLQFESFWHDGRCHDPRVPPDAAIFY